jgi:hypothetical protein
MDTITTAADRSRGGLTWTTRVRALGTLGMLGMLGILVILVMAAADLTTARSLAAEHTPGPRPQAGGSSARDVRRQALESLPLDRMPAAQRSVVEAFARSSTIFRRLPEATVACDSDLLTFLLDKPEVLVDVWRVLDISRLSLDPVAASQWRLSDGYGTVGTVRLLHRERTRDGGLIVFHGRGAYTGPLSPKKLTGSCLVVVRHRADGTEVHGMPRHTVAVDAFLDVDGLGLEIVTRALHPLIVHSAASNLHEVALFVTQFAAAGARNPGGVARLTDRMPRTAPEDRRTLARLAGGVGSAADDDLPDDALRTELAARWLSVEQLDTVRR